MEEKTILIVDDTVTNLNILAEHLDDYDVIEATNGQDALEIAEEEENLNLILLDIMMPDMDGYEVCKQLKKNPKTKDIPVIFITAKTDENSIEKAYDIGGTDYVTKPFQPKELLARVKKELHIQDLLDELRQLASTDPMTKLYNRRYFTKLSEHAMALVKRDAKNLSILMIDIDNFKCINDTYGHQIGDDVIIKLADIFLKQKRKSDIVSRWGGEEFLILLPNTNSDGAIVIAEKFRKLTEDVVINLEANQELKFTISIGVSLVDIEVEFILEAAIKRADEALYEAKKNGRNQVFGPSIIQK